MSKTLSRGELYRLVWSKPMTHLAREFGISDVALHKHCRRHAIPTPPQGYWARMAHGKPVVQTALPTDPGQHGGGPIVICTGASARENPTVASARTRVLEALAQPEAVPPGDSPVLAATLARLDRSAPDRTGVVRVSGLGLITVTVRAETRPRARRLLEELVHTAQRARIATVPGAEAAVWQVDDQTVSFALSEVADRIAHVPTERELHAVERWEAERQARFRRSGYLSDYGRPYIAKWEERLQGRLAIMLEAVRDRSASEYGGAAIRSTFADAKNRDVAKAIPRIVASVAVIAATKRGNAIADARRLREREAAEARRREAERRASIERSRVGVLGPLLEAHAEETRLAAWLAELGKASAAGEVPPRVARLQMWAGERLARLRAAAGPEALETLLTQKGVFGEDEV